MFTLYQLRPARGRFLQRRWLEVVVTGQHQNTLVRRHVAAELIKQCIKPAALEKAATRWPKLNIDFMTVHASKGQQADYVIVLGLQEGFDGFPAPARESIMEQALLPAPEDFPDAEERRLLYVAMTRARLRVWLLFNKAQLARTN